MRASLVKSLLIAGTAMMNLMAMPAFAQSADESVGNDDAIIVTARRIEEDVQDVPISMTVLSQEQLTARNITSSVELATYTPSLVVNKRFGPDKAAFAIRGFTQDLTTAPTVAVYFADVIAPRLISNLGGGNGAGPGSMFDLQNVQVLYGPQGTLFGRNTNGGAVLLVPRKPTGQLEGYVEGTIGNYNQRRVQAVLNVPLADTFKVRGGIDWNKRDGYVKNLSGVGPKDFNDIDYFAARLSILAELTPNLENYTLFTYTKGDTHGTLGKYAFCNPGSNPASAGFAAVTRADNCTAFARQANYGYWESDNKNPDPFVRTEIWQVINTTTWRASDALTVKNIASYGESKEAYSLAVLGDFVPFPLVRAIPGTLGPQGHQFTFTEELQFQGASGDLTWQGGGYAEISNPIGRQEQYGITFADCTDVYAFKCTPLTVNIPGRGPTPIGAVSILRHNYYYRNYGIYVQGTYKFSEQFSLTAGLRYTRDTTRATGDNIRVVAFPTGPVAFSCGSSVTPPGAGTAALLSSRACFASFREKSSKPTWLINLDYNPIGSVHLYAKYARGYRAGGGNPSNTGFETWSPESVDNYEVGVKTTIRGSAVRGSFNIAGFWNDFTNQQVPISLPACTVAAQGAVCTNPASAGVQAIQNIGTSRIRGIEIDGSLTFFDDFRLDYGYAYLDAKVRDTSFPGCDTSRFACATADVLQPEQRLLFSPRHRLTLTGTYTLPLDESMGELSVGATYVHTAKSFFSHNADVPFALGEIPFNSSVLPASDLINLNLTWNKVGGSAIDVALFATNVTKEKTRVGAGNALRTVGADFIFVGEPRIYGLRVKYNFGE